MKKFNYIFLGLIVLLLDRVTKLAVLAYCANGCQINQLLSFDLIYNRGISWGLFHSSSNIVFGIVSLLIALITAGLFIYALKQARAGHVMVGETLVIAGSIGNLIDRVWYSGVIDFIELSYHGYVWPLFNIADMCIVLGVIIMLAEYYRS